MFFFFFTLKIMFPYIISNSISREFLHLFPPISNIPVSFLATVKIVLPIMGFQQFEYVVPRYDFLYAYPVSVPVYFSDLQANGLYKI